MACNLLNEDDTFFGFDTFPMMMIIYGMQSVQWGWYFFWVLEPHKWRWSFLTCSLLEQGEHFWDEIFSMMIILFLVLKPPQWGLIIYGMQSAQWWWYLFFFGFWSPLNEDDHFWHAVCSRKMSIFDMRSCQWWWYFFLGFEAPSMRITICGMQSAQWSWYLFLWVLKPPQRKMIMFGMQSDFWDEIFSMMMIFFWVLKAPQRKMIILACSLLNGSPLRTQISEKTPFRTQSSEKSLSEHRFHRKPLPNTDFRELAKHSKKG